MAHFSALRFSGSGVRLTRGRSSRMAACLLCSQRQKTWATSICLLPTSSSLILLLLNKKLLPRGHPFRAVLSCYTPLPQCPVSDSRQSQSRSGNPFAPLPPTDNHLCPLSASPLPEKACVPFCSLFFFCVCECELTDLSAFSVVAMM